MSRNSRAKKQWELLSWMMNYCPKWCLYFTHFPKPTSFNSSPKPTTWNYNDILYHLFAGDGASKEPACNVGDLSSIPGLGRSPGEGKRYPHQYSGLENSMDCTVHGVAESDTSERLSLLSLQPIFPASFSLTPLYHTF